MNRFLIIFSFYCSYLSAQKKLATGYWSDGSEVKNKYHVYPELRPLSKLGHAYLYGNEYDNAITIYGTLLRKEIRSSRNWKQTMQAAYTYFKEKGYDVKPFKKVFSEMKLKIPN